MALKSKHSIEKRRVFGIFKGGPVKKTPSLVRVSFNTRQGSHPRSNRSCCGFFLVINLLMSFDDQGGHWSKIKVRVLVVGALIRPVKNLSRTKLTIIDNIK